jgi:murein DD-endopeptidase MepM/ murein hydrolase activator NlpD
VLSTRTDIHRRTPGRRAGAPLLALAVVAALTLGGTAQAQSGGTGSPGGTTPPVVPPTTATGAPAQVFPVIGPHTFGDGFGAGRGHQGVDIFARCGAMLVANAAGKVVVNGVHPSAGNYLIIRSKRFQRDYVYMHLLYPSPILKKAKVVPGQFVGAVGETGNASGCHLHFEIWRGKWYRGGRAMDPMASLLAWDAYS